jgi:hypothetical protein
MDKGGSGKPGWRFLVDTTRSPEASNENPLDGTPAVLPLSVAFSMKYSAQRRGTVPGG